ncbi:MULTISPECIES: energy transducer TonB [unclassified Acinetobacter]|uniref:TonB family protein n=1 Tax=Acinetobacter corruptisaponis TaxID=3045147 RepID=A0ABY8SAB1_9GAMM|nr:MULTISPECIES: energy transducer TonB [unclassified Acinetobacter]MDH0031067.1 TonB family protein [Acinetobacter sp. GD04021]MDH0886653.1 TonB family protein [Acinetobacter sp. GD03873]MDH1083214.1 TonB family protein [Acinetobacter sp. GD03983]MDH2189273.1 TonB family protein [Acinetobacter sp. GD03645]MDH2202920.1 TonB family protein [Acinetobacter sp. GD03647]
MSQSPAILNTPHPMKKKIIAALVAVVIGHVGVLWAVSHMKTIELRPVEKQPLKVKFVKIKEPPKPEPPKPKEKPKPPEPKKEVKEVKVVEKALPPPPKKIQQVKKAETPKPVVETVEPKVESVVVSTTVVEKPQPVVEAPKPAAPPADPSPKRVSIGGSGVQWSRSPKLSVSAKDLENQPRSAMVLIEADEKGKITNARITRSSGLPSLDEKILRAVRSAKFKPYMENGVAYPIRAEQPFDLSP